MGRMGGESWLLPTAIDVQAGSAQMLGAGWSSSLLSREPDVARGSGPARSRIRGQCESVAQMHFLSWGDSRPTWYNRPLPLGTLELTWNYARVLRNTRRTSQKQRLGMEGCSYLLRFPIVFKEQCKKGANVKRTLVDRIPEAIVVAPLRSVNCLRM